MISKLNKSENVWKGPCTVRSKFNKFEHVQPGLGGGGRGSLYGVFQCIMDNGYIRHSMDTQPDMTENITFP